MKKEGKENGSVPCRRGWWRCSARKAASGGASPQPREPATRPFHLSSSSSAPPYPSQHPPSPRPTPRLRPASARPRRGRRRRRRRREGRRVRRRTETEAARRPWWGAGGTTLSEAGRRNSDCNGTLDWMVYYQKKKKNGMVWCETEVRGAAGRRVVL